MTKRNRAKFKYKHNPSTENLIKYKRLRNRCSRICRDAQRLYIHNTIKNSNSSQTWKFLQSLGIGRQPCPINPNLDLNALNGFFATTIPMDIKEKIKTLSILRSLPIPNNPPFQFSTMALSDIRAHILAIKSNAMGSDGINRRMLLLILDQILPVISHIFNSSLSSGQFPRAWRIAHILPIPKNKNPVSFSHYRPISILPFLSKVLERIVHRQLNDYILKYNILSKYQSGFRMGHSTVTALVKVCDDLRSNMDNKQLSILTLLDFSNAFNAVDFELLLAVLQSINVATDVSDWFRSYLFGRRQSVHINNQSSSYLPLTTGVPQGSVLSPLLFSIFINTIPKILSSSFHLYADDLQVYVTCTAHDIDDAIARLNQDLLNISNWCKAYGLHVNPAKSQAIIIGSTFQLSKLNRSKLPAILYDNVSLTLCSHVKNLGLLIDSNLSWSVQVAEVSRKIFATISSFKRLKHLLPVKTKICLAQSLLLPILDYADCSYTDLTEEQLNKLERLQNVCIKFIFALRKFDHVSEYRDQLKWLTIRHRRNLHILSLLYSILYNPYSPNYLKTRFSFLGTDTDCHLDLRSRSDNRLKMPTAHTRFYSESFTVKAVKLWNMLPPEIRRSDSIYIFKRRVKTHYLSLQ